MSHRGPFFALALLVVAAVLPAGAGAQLALSDRVFDRVLVDSVDGVIWARGSNYKASFSEAGASFIPYLGPRAPHNFPVSFAIESVMGGGERLRVDRSRAAVIEHHEVSIDRGACTEIYRLSVDKVEQLFRFDRRPEAGDLAVRLAIGTELDITQAADGAVLFSNDLGGVRYEKAIVLDAAGRRLAMEIGLQDGKIELRVPAAFLDGATFPVTIDPTMYSFGFGLAHVPGASTDLFLNADVAYDGATGIYLTTYEHLYSATDHDVYVFSHYIGQSPPQTGTITQIDFTTSNWAKPKIANCGLVPQFLVVAERTLSGGAIVVGGRLVDAATFATSVQFQISSGEVGQKSNPDVGGDPTGYYCVVWQNTSPSGQSNVYFRIVTDTGSLGTSNALGLVSGIYNDSFPSISKSNRNSSSPFQDWMVVFQRRAAPSNEDIWGAAIHWTGAVINDGFPIDTSPLSHTRPQVSTQAEYGYGFRRFLAVYQEFTGGGPIGIPDEDLMACVLDTSGPVDAPVNLTSLFLLPPNDDQLNPCVDSDGVRFAVGFTQKGSPFATEQGIPYVGTVHLYAALTIGVTEYPVATNGYLGADENLQIASAYGGGGGFFQYMAAWHTVDATNTFGSIQAAIWNGWSAAAAGGPSSWFNYALPGCGGLTMATFGFPAIGDLVGMTLSGVQGIPFFVIGASIPPVALCDGCLLGVNPIDALIIQADTLWFYVPADGSFVHIQVAIQGADIGSTTGCLGSPPLTLSEEVIMTIL